MHRIFGKKDAAVCAICGKDLGRHRYRPAKEWNISGLLCSDCHVDKTKEAMMRQQAEEVAPDKCAICGKDIISDEDRNKAKWQWEMESGSLLCRACFAKKDGEHEKRTNFCAVCNGKLGIIYYHPKSAWKIEGNLCKKCWDNRNRRGP